MPWSLSWSADAVNSLAEIWLETSDRSSLTAEIHAMEAQLRQRPRQISTELHEGLRTVDTAGVRLYLELDDARHEVHVHNVGWLTLTDE